MTTPYGTTRILALALFLCLGTALVASAPEASLVKERYSLEILVDGQPLEKHLARGRTYIEALAGREYSIRLHNNTPRRIAIALSVDGLNTIDARTTTAQAASKWILDPWQSITLDGWQTSNATARRFFFTTESASYGAWLGRTSDLGVITAAVFREKRPRPAPILQQRDPSRMEKGGARGAESGPSRDAAEAPATPRSESAAEPSDDLAATGIGREVGNEVQRVSFDAEPAPAEVLEIRYEYRDALVRLGVLPDDRPCREPLARRERARGFDGMEFAPDPYDARCP